MANEFKVKNGLIVDQGGITATGSVYVSGSTTIYSSGSNVFAVDGTSGRLFSIDDSLSGSLFAVNTAAGLPIIEAFSDNTIRMGQYGRQVLYISQSSIGLGKESALNAFLDISGSVAITGSLFIKGPVSASNFSGSLLGTASYANNADLLDGVHLASLATTGSNSFNGNQIISGTLLISSSAVNDLIVSGGVSISGSFSASIQQGYTWVGDANGFSRPVATSSFGSAGGGNSFTTIAVAGQSNVVADSSTDTLTLAAGSGITITTDATTDTVTLFATTAGAIFPYTGSAIVSGSFTTTGSFFVRTTGSVAFSISGSQGPLFTITDTTSSTLLATISSGSNNILEVTNTGVNVSGSFVVDTAGIDRITVSGSVIILSSSLLISGGLTDTTLSNAVSAVNNVSALSAGAGTAIGLQNVVNALSNRLSAAGALISANPYRYVSTVQTITSATLTGISGLTVSVSAGVIYKIEGQILYSVSAATGAGFGLIWPTANRAAGTWAGGISVNITGATTYSTMAFGTFDTGDSNSAVWIGAVGLTGLHHIMVDGIIDAQTGGALYPAARGSASANSIIIARGSYMKLFRIN